MSRSIKKGPFVEKKLYERICDMNKKGEKRAKGHRQPYTQVKITSIEA